MSRFDLNSPYQSDFLAAEERDQFHKLNAYHPTADDPPPPFARLVRNTERGGIEIWTTSKPDEQTRGILRENSFRWSGKTGCWWVRYNEPMWEWALAFVKKLNEVGP